MNTLQVMKLLSEENKYDRMAQMAEYSSRVYSGAKDLSDINKGKSLFKALDASFVRSRMYTDGMVAIDPIYPELAKKLIDFYVSTLIAWLRIDHGILSGMQNMEAIKSSIDTGDSGFSLESLDEKSNDDAEKFMNMLDRKLGLDVGLMGSSIESLGRLDIGKAHHDDDDEENIKEEYNETVDRRRLSLPKINDGNLVAIQDSKDMFPHVREVKVEFNRSEINKRVDEHEDIRNKEIEFLTDEISRKEDKIKTINNELEEERNRIRNQFDEEVNPDYYKTEDMKYLEMERQSEQESLDRIKQQKMDASLSKETFKTQAESTLTGATIYVQVTPYIVDPDQSNKFLDFHHIHSNLNDRIMMWRAGEIKFWADVVFNRVGREKQKEILRSAPSGALMDIFKLNRKKRRRQASDFLTTVLSFFNGRKPSVSSNLASTIVILSKEAVERAKREHRVDITLPKHRQEFFSVSLTGMLAVVDIERSTIDIYFNGFPAVGHYHFDQFKGKSKSSETFDALKAMAEIVNNKPPSLL